MTTVDEDARRFLNLEELAEICARADLGQYGEYGELVHRLAFELGITHTALLEAAVVKGGGEDGT